MIKNRKIEIEKPFALAGLVLFFMALIVIYLYRDDIFQTIQDPRQPFQTYTKPVAPDYSTSEAWLAQPDLSLDPFEHPSAGDAFVVVPSVYRMSPLMAVQAACSRPITVKPRSIVS